MQNPKEWLQSVTVEAPQIVAETFVVFPLTVAETNGRDYWTFEEATQQGLVVVPETGRVPAFGTGQGAPHSCQLRGAGAVASL